MTFLVLAIPCPLAVPWPIGCTLAHWLYWFYLSLLAVVRLQAIAKYLKHHHHRHHHHQPTNSGAAGVGGLSCRRPDTLPTP